MSIIKITRQANSSIPPTSAGFTLIELLITVAIMAIVATLAVPSFGQMLRVMEARTVESSLHDWLKSARADALIYQRSVIVCIADDRLNCVARDGTRLLTFIDQDDDNQFDRTKDNLLQQHDITLRFGYMFASLAANRNYIKLTPQTGRPVGYMGSFNYCTRDNDLTRHFKVSFNMTGGIKTKPHSTEATRCS